ncbi:hypothetical protein TW95_gp1614 [Pandoravirus inopinatum]|uniref:Uncharacterized protein n=1 Tax=Pandoravirus inopinatum TaxID=1605721 RepID=A0A0B5IZL1_9VIRU|nr:hypothetical protein TW95_gp1614 [Pandoravirus inopinatum]AJF98348.1 hypothetical protein [Pandoravirus inopinatum]
MGCDRSAGVLPVGVARARFFPSRPHHSVRWRHHGTRRGSRPREAPAHLIPPFSPHHLGAAARVPPPQQWCTASKKCDLGPSCARCPLLPVHGAFGDFFTSVQMCFFVEFFCRGSFFYWAGLVFEPLRLCNPALPFGYRRAVIASFSGRPPSRIGGTAFFVVPFSFFFFYKKHFSLFCRQTKKAQTYTNIWRTIGRFLSRSA